MHTLILFVYKHRALLLKVLICVGFLMSFTLTREILILVVAAVLSLLKIKQTPTDTDTLDVRAKRALEAAEAVRIAQEKYERNIESAKSEAGRKKEQEIDNFLDKDF
jgi:hypothetical protein